MAFGDDEDLTRYVHPVERTRSGRAAVSAFLLSDADLASKSAHLSVNSTRLETLSRILEYYQTVRQSGSGEVAYCTHSVSAYVKAGKRAGAQLTKSSGEWAFPEASSTRPAFRERPVSGTGSPSTDCKSHCGVEFIRSMSHKDQTDLARALARYPRFRVHTFAP